MLSQTNYAAVIKQSGISDVSVYLTGFNEVDKKTTIQITLGKKIESLGFSSQPAPSLVQWVTTHRDQPDITASLLSVSRYNWNHPDVTGTSTASSADV